MYRQVPASIIDLAPNPKLFFNLRPEQDFAFAHEKGNFWVGGMSEVYGPLYQFLRSLNEGTRVAVLFQSYGGKELHCAVSTVERMYFDSQQYPQLRYIRPGKRQGEDDWAEDIWGVFLLAIAVVTDDAPLFEVEDSASARQFVQAFKRWAALPSSDEDD